MGDNKYAAALLPSVESAQAAAVDQALADVSACAPNCPALVRWSPELEAASRQAAEAVKTAARASEVERLRPLTAEWHPRYLQASR
jgi:hypothetical protein